jgi:hypothetical protein
MDKDSRKNASGWEIRRQERNSSFIVGSKTYMFQKICGYRKENNKNTKRPNNSYNMFWIVGKEHRRDFHKTWRRGRKI